MQIFTHFFCNFLNSPFVKFAVLKSIDQSWAIPARFGDIRRIKFLVNFG